MIINSNLNTKILKELYKDAKINFLDTITEISNLNTTEMSNLNTPHNQAHSEEENSMEDTYSDEEKNWWENEINIPVNK